MRPPRPPADRLRDLVRTRIAPALGGLGFQLRRSTFVCQRDEVTWLLDVELAVWSTSRRLSFTVVWGVDVPALDEVLGDGRGVRRRRAWSCPVHARLGERPGRLDARWFTVGAEPFPLSHVRPWLDAADARTAGHVVRLVAGEAVPALAQLDTAAAVQERLVAGLERARGAPSDAELARIRRIAALSLLLGERHNASRWLDYLEARSSAALPPDVVAERLAPLRQHCA